MQNNRPNVILIIIDAVGIKTLEYLLDKYTEKVSLPSLEKLGLGTLLDQRFHKRVKPVKEKTFAHKVTQESAEADSVVGHREIAGIVDEKKYELFYNGMPNEYINEFEKRIGVKTMFNQMAGGMDAIKQNYIEHKKTGYPIVYMSMCDPLIQIAMDETVIPIEKAKKIVDTSFDLAKEMNIPITRSIYRPFIITNEQVIIRTTNRYDRVHPLESETLIDLLHDNGISTVSIGKTADMIPTKNWSKTIVLKTKNDIDPSLDLKFVHPAEKDTNPYTIQGIFNELENAQNGDNNTFIFANCCDTDSVYGHTQDVEGSIKAIEEIDRSVGKIINKMSDNDYLFITADHGMEHRGNYGYHSKVAVYFLGYTKNRNNALNELVVKDTTTFVSIGDIFKQIYSVLRL